MNIFDKIRESRANVAKHMVKLTTLGTASAAGAAKPSAEEQPSVEEPTYVSNVNSETNGPPASASGLRMPLRRNMQRAIPSDVIIRAAPPAEVEIGPFLNLSATPLDEEDEDEDEDEDDGDADEDEDADDEIEEGGPVSFGGFQIDETPEPPEPPEPPKRLHLRPMSGLKVPAIKPSAPAANSPSQAKPSVPSQANGSPESVSSASRSNPPSQANGSPPSPPSPPEPRKVISANSPLGRLKASSQPGEVQREQEAAEFGKRLMAAPVTPVISTTGLSMPRGTGGTGGTGISPAAREFIAAADVEKLYTVESYLTDWRELADLDDNADNIDISAFNLARKELIQRACGRISQIFTTELDGLSISAGADHSITEISNLVKLTFLRVKEAPGAYAMLDLADRSQLIKGMRAMAAKRNASVKGRKPGIAKEISIHSEGLGIGVDENGMPTGFDLLAFGD